MLLTKRTIINVTEEQSIILGHLGYSAYKLWNVANYEKKNYKELGFEKFPNWYEQKKSLKDNFFYKNLPSQTAQELLNQLQQSWQSFFTLVKTKGIKNPKPPRFKKDIISITYLKDAIQKHGNTIRLSLPRQLKEYLSTQSLDTTYLYLKNKCFSDIQNIKQVKLNKLNNGSYEVFVIYEIADITKLLDNSHYLSIDIGINNLMTCYDNNGAGFIVSGNTYLNACYYYNKKISHLQSVYDKQQDTKYPKKSKKVLNLYKKRKNCINDIIHKATRYVTDYCIKNDIHSVVIGDITHIRDNNNLGRTNQSFHALPFDKICQKLKYKLNMYGITLIKQKESYSSQCSPLSKDVSKVYAIKSNRKHRGLYIDNSIIYNADMVGAYNILRLLVQKTKKEIPKPLIGLSNPLKVTV